MDPNRNPPLAASKRMRSVFTPSRDTDSKTLYVLEKSCQNANVLPGSRQYYFVSLFSQCGEVVVTKSSLRKRCAWENGKWVTIKKDQVKRAYERLSTLW